MTLSKKGYRTAPIIERNNDDVEQSPAIPSWMKEFAKNVEKTAVQPYKQDKSIFDQISSIMNGSQSKFPTVEHAVKDMQERSGLLAYKSRVEAQKIDVQKLAKLVRQAGLGSDEDDVNTESKETIKLFQMKPQIKDTFDNYIEDTHGNLSIPSVIEKIKSIHKMDVNDDELWDDDSILRYVNKKSIDAKKKHPDTDSNAFLGKLPHFNESDIDPSNRDPLHALMPATIK